jgi:hypothetical protein
MKHHHVMTSEAGETLQAADSILVVVKDGNAHGAMSSR